MLDRSGSFIIEMGPFEYGSTANDPIIEAYEMANKFYEPNREIKVWVYINAWGDNEYVELPYAGPLN